MRIKRAVNAVKKRRKILKLAKELGINCYDREILRMASDASGINETLFEKADERLKSNLFRISSKVYKGQLISPDKSDFVSNDNLFNYQAKIIRDLAERENCIFCAEDSLVCVKLVVRDEICESLCFKGGYLMLVDFVF